MDFRLAFHLFLRFFFAQQVIFYEIDALFLQLNRNVTTDCNLKKKVLNRQIDFGIFDNDKGVRF